MGAKMVHDEPMSDDWPIPSPQVAALIVEGVTQVITPRPEWLAELNAAALRAVRLDEIAQDPTMLQVILTINEANLAQWARSNAEAPGKRVPVRQFDDAADASIAAMYVREMVRRGLDSAMLDSFRTAQAVAWQRWMEICFTLTDDVGLLHELLDVTLRSIAAFVDDTVAQLADQIAIARAELAGDTHAERRAAVALVLEGAPISTSRAEAQLFYRLSGPHTALVISRAPFRTHDLEAISDAIMAANGLTSKLTVLAGADQLWMWFPTAELAIKRDLVPTGVRVAVGSPGHDREGFRRSHFQALSTNETALRLGASQAVVRFAELALVAAMSDEVGVVDDFIAQTLGDLRTADEQLRSSMRVWFAEQCNASATASRLFTHRNTVVRRIARASDLLPIPLSENAIAVAAALELQHWTH